MESLLKLYSGQAGRQSLLMNRGKHIPGTRYVLPENWLTGNGKINERMTDRIIELQERGFDMDFQYIGSRQVLCLQNNFIYGSDHLQIMAVEQTYDQFSNSRKYIHSVDTFEGLRGILLAEKSYDNCLPA